MEPQNQKPGEIFELPDLSFKDRVTHTVSFIIWLINYICLKIPPFAKQIWNNGLLAIRKELLMARRHKKLGAVSEPSIPAQKPVMEVFEHSSTAKPSLLDRIIVKIPVLCKLSHSQLKIVSLAVASVAIFTIGAFAIIDNNIPIGQSTTKVLGSGSANGVVSTENSASNKSCPGGDEKPKFKMIFPDGKNASDFGGVCRTSPITSAPVFTYLDKIGVNNLKVNEQELPDELNNDSELSKFAVDNYYKDSFSATTSDITVYIGKDINNAQFLVFTKNELLIFIKADTLESQSVWNDYISSLK